LEEYLSSPTPSDEGIKRVVDELLAAKFEVPAVNVEIISDLLT